MVVERLHIEEPEPPAPVTEPEKTFEEVLDEHPVSIQVNGQWQTFPNAKAAEEASYEEYKANLRRNAKNFRITDEHLGEGGPKAKFQANVNAIRLLKDHTFNMQGLFHGIVLLDNGSRNGFGSIFSRCRLHGGSGQGGRLGFAVVFGAVQVEQVQPQGIAHDTEAVKERR